MDNHISVVDIGTSKISVTIGHLSDKGSIEVVGFASVSSLGVKRGVVKNIEEVVPELKKALTEATKNLNIEICKVLVCFTGKSVHTIPHTSGCKIEPHQNVSPQHVNKLIEEVRKTYAGNNQKIYHVIPHKFIIDSENEVAIPVGKPANQLEGYFNLMAANEKYLKDIESCFSKLNIKVKGIILAPLATAEAVLTDKEKENGSLLVDIGAGTTDVAIFLKGTIHHIGVIPFGGHSITHDVQEACSIQFNYAENLKEEYGNAFSKNITENNVIEIKLNDYQKYNEISFKNLSLIIQSRLEEIIDGVIVQLKKSGLAEQLNAGIVITGGTSLLPGIKDLFQHKTGMKARIGIPSIPLTGKTPENLRHPAYSTPLGLLYLAATQYQGKEDFVVGKEQIKNTSQQKETSSSFGKKNKSGFKKLTDFVGELFSDDDMNME